MIGLPLCSRSNKSSRRTGKVYLFGVCVYEGWAVIALRARTISTAPAVAAWLRLRILDTKNGQISLRASPLRHGLTKNHLNSMMKVKIFL